MSHNAHLRRLNKLEERQQEREQTVSAFPSWQELRALPQEDLLRLREEHRSRTRTPEKEAQAKADYERMRHLPVEELLRLHYESVR